MLTCFLVLWGDNSPLRFAFKEEYMSFLAPRRMALRYGWALDQERTGVLFGHRSVTNGFWVFALGHRTPMRGK